MEESIAAESPRPLMDHREITLVDGRYMIFYTFEGTATLPPTDNDEVQDAD